MLRTEVGGDHGLISVDREAVRPDEVLRGLEAREEPADVRHVHLDRQTPRGRLGLVVTRVDEHLVREDRPPQLPVPGVETEGVAMDQVAEVGLVVESPKRVDVDRVNLRSWRNACSS